jgi:hypothetical protein
VENLAGIDAMLSSCHGGRFSGLQGLFDHLAPLLLRSISSFGPQADDIQQNKNPATAHWIVAMLSS